MNFPEEENVINLWSLKEENEKEKETILKEARLKDFFKKMKDFDSQMQRLRREMTRLQEKQILHERIKKKERTRQ